jgi:glycosyltransferase involved in cell wall biosynthesis
MSSRRTRILFVGRISPNKRQDDLIRMLAYYRACIDPEAHLYLVGGYRDQPQYHARLAALRDALDLGSAVVLTGPVSIAALVAYYRRASVFCSLSEHEGFGVPLLEAMHLGLPVVAYDAAAVGETLDGGGIKLPRKDLAEAAETCALVVERDDLRKRLVATGRRRARDFATEAVAQRTKEALGL